jgi:nucleoside-diphosphate-sugar epimerase
MTARAGAGIAFWPRKAGDVTDFAAASSRGYARNQQENRHRRGNRDTGPPRHRRIALARARRPVLSRSSPDYRVDLTTGAGLGAAVAGCDVVVDVSNDASKHAAQTLVGGSRRLLAAGQAAGVRHHVCVSITASVAGPLR